MKYSLKEKIILYNRLQNQQSAQTDLQFLQEIQPELKIEKAWTMNPERYANKILYLLLDYASSEDIVKNRRASSPMKIYIPRLNLMYKEEPILKDIFLPPMFLPNLPKKKESTASW